MKKNTQVLDQTDGTERSLVRQHRHKISLHQLALRVIIGALLLVAIAGSNAIVLVNHAYAMSDCGVLFACPTPTPRPTPTPTPNPTPTPSPNPTPSPTPSLQPSATVASLPAAAPTARISASPTAIATAASTQVIHTPVPTPKSIPVTQNKHSGKQTANLSGESGFSHMLPIIAIIFLCLLFGLIIGFLVLRRMLLPSIKVKVPADVVSSWTLTAPDMPPDETSTTIKTAPDLPTIHTDNPWYSVSDEPFMT